MFHYIFMWGILSAGDLGCEDSICVVAKADSFCSPPDEISPSSAARAAIPGSGNDQESRAAVFCTLLYLIDTHHSQVVYRIRPSAFEQWRQRTIFEDPADGLASGTIIEFPIGKHHALDGSDADRVRFRKFSAHCHLPVKSRSFFRKTVPCLIAKRRNPVSQHPVTAVKQCLDLLTLQSLCPFHWREFCNMKYFVRAGVADAVKQPWINQRFLECSVLSLQPYLKFFHGAVKDVQPAPGMHLQRLRTAMQMDRSSLF